MKTLFLVIAVLCLLVGLFFITAGSAPATPEGNWNLKLHVVDISSNSLSDVEVRVVAMGKISAINKVFGIPPKKWYIQERTDTNGNCILILRACVLGVIAVKEGYQELNDEEDQSLHPTGFATDFNRSLRIVRGKVQKR